LTTLNSFDFAIIGYGTILNPSIVVNGNQVSYSAQSISYDNSGCFLVKRDVSGYPTTNLDTEDTSYLNSTQITLFTNAIFHEETFNVSQNFTDLDNDNKLKSSTGALLIKKISNTDDDISSQLWNNGDQSGNYVSNFNNVKLDNLVIDIKMQIFNIFNNSTDTISADYWNKSLDTNNKVTLGNTLIFIFEVPYRTETVNSSINIAIGYAIETN
tara:strand:+ start:27754 stop:28392 length:639 start_codon:yes stop_codon:yes gene_type:complete